MPGLYSEADSLKHMAESLISQYHPELVDARIRYLFCEKSSKKNGVDQPGKVHKLSGLKEYLLETDYIVEVALDKWNDLTETQRAALVDHLLERCWGEEDEQTGEMKWKLRDPDVQEFATILRRHGIWQENLRNFVEVAHGINIDDIIEEESDVDMANVLEVDVTD